MVKRCSAKNCYNSQLTHKVAYFGYPKNELVARKWAKLAGREDLVDKRLENLTKYYLCSDHFSSEAFLNPKVEDKSFLRLNKLYEIPTPTIFVDNLMENVKSVTQNPEKFMNYTKQPSECIVRSPEQMRQHSFDAKFEVKEEITEEQFELIETEEFVEYIEEDLEITRTDEVTENNEVFNYCRLCARTSDDLIPIFDDRGDFSEEAECLRLMPQGIISKDDNLPQHSCPECLEKLQSCASIIEGFVSNQSLFVSE